MTTPLKRLPSSRAWTGAVDGQEMFQTYSKEEYKARTNAHYEQPPEFFFPILGGEWQVYSCNLWERATNDTESQEEKLDLFATLMSLRPGQRILDVGCGWGGPLVYLCKTYGVSGVGLNLSPTQRRVAQQRAADYGVDVQIHECNWEDFQDDQGFDAVYTDEAIVHFTNLGQFFGKIHSLLRPGGVMLNKECHFTSSRYNQKLTRANVFHHEIFGLTGSYRTLADELTLVDQNNFEVRTIHQIDLEHYRKTADRWLSNMHQHKQELQALVGEEYYRQFRAYLKIVRRTFSGTKMTLDVIVSHKI
ncbi:MAG TPA: class I SAM-dependent methyltransferase [Herpetosiphonaceae bacterium]